MRGSPGALASPPTFPSPLLRLKGLVGTFDFTSDVALTTTSAWGARWDLRLHLRCLSHHYFGSKGSPAHHHLQRLGCMTTASPSITTITTSTFMSSTSTISTTCEAYLMNTSQEELGVH
jgi:hypothetical protein